jgi:hypothetical protein
MTMAFGNNAKQHIATGPAAHYVKSLPEPSIHHLCGQSCSASFTDDAWLAWHYTMLLCTITEELR